MAIKKLSFNEGGLVSEETLERPAKRAVPETPPREAAGRAKSNQAIRAEHTDDDDDGPVEPRAARAVPAAAGKSVLDKDVIKVRCPRCSSERVVESAEAKLTCGLCGTAMKLVS